MKDLESETTADKWEVQLRKGCLELAVLRLAVTSAAGRFLGYVNCFL
jgi:hypothetical protein